MPARPTPNQASPVLAYQPEPAACTPPLSPRCPLLGADPGASQGWELPVPHRPVSAATAVGAEPGDAKPLAVSLRHCQSTQSSLRPPQVPAVVLTQVRCIPGAGLLTAHYYSRYEFEVSQRVPKVIMCCHRQRCSVSRLPEPVQGCFTQLAEMGLPGMPYTPQCLPETSSGESGPFHPGKEPALTA